jgi:putative phosphoribosyl transferase
MFERNRIFADRPDAGRKLAERLKGRSLEKPVVLALPRGGVPVAYEIATALNAPLDVVLVRKIGAPGHEEFALGALVDGASPIVIVNEGVPSRYGEHIREEAKRQGQEIERRRALYRGGSPPEEVRGRTVIVVDDGIATGASLRAALTALKRAGAAKVIAAIPVAPAESLTDLEPLADEIVCLATPEPFYAVGLHYANFEQTSDDEVIQLLKAAAARSAKQPSA